jgi:glycosyltransferase involved in cell wall biosynthesis
VKQHWLIVTGGYHRTGGQDRANLELALSLAGRADNVVHLVGHEFDPDLERSSSIVVHRVDRPAGSTFLGERALARATGRLLQTMPTRPIVISNGGNFVEGDVNWVHCVHAFWPVAHFHPPLKARLTAEIAKRAARKRELLAFRQARVIIANSDQTRAQLLSLGVAPANVGRIYFGATERNRVAPAKTKKLIFIGALGWDRNKGLDRLLRALHLLARQSDFAHSLTVIGAGEDRPWRQLVAELGLGSRVQFMGKVQDVAPHLRQSELLVSPSRYEAYGLAVQDALTLGVPALVTRTSGIAERYPEELSHLLVDNTDSAQLWAKSISDALSSSAHSMDAIRKLGAEISRRTWKTMSEELEAEIRRRLELPSVAGSGVTTVPTLG